MQSVQHHIKQVQEKLNAEIIAEYSEDNRKVTLTHITAAGQLVQSECLKEKHAVMLLENLLYTNKHKVKRVNADISLYLHDKLKQKCLDKQITMREALEDMIRNYLKD